MEMFGFTSVETIVVVCYLIAMALKATKLDNKWLPVICGVLGAVLGIAGWLYTNAVPADNWLTALAIGVVSGLAATGFNQIGKQLSSGGGDDVGN